MPKKPNSPSPPFPICEYDNVEMFRCSCKYCRDFQARNGFTIVKPYPWYIRLWKELF